MALPLADDTLVLITIAVVAGANGLALMEAVHGTAPDIAGKNLANPTALLFSGVMMLRHLGMHDIAENIQQAALAVIAEGKYRTGDLGGKSTCSDYTKAIIDKLHTVDSD